MDGWNMPLPPVFIRSSFCSVSNFPSLLLLFYLCCFISFSNTQLCTLPSTFASPDLSSPFSPADGVQQPDAMRMRLFAPQRACACEPDWMDALCARVHSYARMPPEKAPSVCVCRQMLDASGGCVQFLTRCFRLPAVLQQSPSALRHRPLVRREQCACCFNQPDAFCRQLDCAAMRPQFDGLANTTCHCHLPTRETTAAEELRSEHFYPPASLCNRHPQQQPSAREAPPEAAESEETDNGASAEERQMLNFRPSPPPARPAHRPLLALGDLFRAQAPPLARFLAFLLLALLASAAMAIVVCFWSNWRRHKRRRRGIRGKRKEERIEEEIAGRMRTECPETIGGNGGLLKEVTV